MKKKILIYTIGFNIVVFGIALLITSQIGQSAWDGVNVGLSQTLSISIGQATIIISITLLTVSYILSKQLNVYLSFLTSLIQGVLIDFYMNIILGPWQSRIFEYKNILFILGLILMAIGCAIYIQSGLPTNHVDRLMISISKRFNLSLRTSKWITDIIAVTVTLILVGKVDIGTFLIIIILGPLISLFAGYVEKPIYNYIES